VALLGLGASACGAGEPGSDAGLPTIFVTPPLCAEARQVYKDDPQPGGEPVTLVCLDRVVHGHSLAAIGAGARRATETSAAIAYVGEPDRRSVDFSAPILEAAGIGAVSDGDGGAAMRRVLCAVRASAGDDDLRAAVREQLEGG
jgi:hypothetical protein